MIDIHSHILPGLDDGAKTLEESIQMCRMSYGDGVRTVVATPHTLVAPYENARSEVLSKLQELNSAIRNFQPALDLRVVPGADVHLCERTLSDLDQGRLTTLNDNGKFLLVEFPSQGIPYGVESVLFQLMTRGITPIITHPERNYEIAHRPERLLEMIKMGCLGQVTAGSLTGDFGPVVRRAAEELLNHRLVHVIASDAHSINGRPPILSKAVRAAERIVGKEEAKKMVTEYPQAILDGQIPNVSPPIPI